MFVNMLHEWSTPLGVVDFEGVVGLNAGLKEIILRKESEFASIPLLPKGTPQYWNRFSQFHRRQGLLDWGGEPIERLREMIYGAASEFARTGLGIENLQPLRIDAWANVSRKGDWHGLHSHYTRAGELISGVYWVYDEREPQSEELDGQLIYYDPRGLSIPERYEKIFKPIPGRMLLHPSWLSHAVAPNRFEALRISVAFDIVVQ